MYYGEKHRDICDFPCKITYKNPIAKWNGKHKIQEGLSLAVNRGVGIGKVHTGNFNRIDCVWFTVAAICSLMFNFIIILVTYKYIAYILLWYQILSNKILIKPHKIGLFRCLFFQLPLPWVPCFVLSNLNEGHRPERRKKCVEDDIYTNALSAQLRANDLSWLDVPKLL